MELLAGIWRSLHGVWDWLLGFAVSYVQRQGLFKVVSWALGFVSGLAVPLWRLWRQAEELSAWFYMHYEEPERQSIDRDAALNAFYGFAGERQLTPLAYATAEIPVKRAVLPTILAAVRSGDAFRHIHVEGGRNEGKTTLLAQIAAAIDVRRDRMLVAYHRASDRQWIGLDAEQLVAHWRRSRWPIIRWRRRRHMLVLLDEVVPLVDTHPSADQRQIFFKRLAASASRSHHVRVVSTSNQRVETKCESIQLQLADGEDLDFLDQLINDGIIDAPLSQAQMIGRIGGRAVYKNSLKGLLASALMLRTAAASRVLRMDDLSAASVPALKRAVAIVAACQCLDIEVPDTLLAILIDVPHDQLMGETRAWIRLRPLGFANVHQLGAALTAPHLAALVLREERIKDDKLVNLYVDIFQRTLTSAPNGSVHREFLRHILYRLVKQRGIRIANGRTRHIAMELSNRFEGQLADWNAQIHDVGEFAGWLLTWARLQNRKAEVVKVHAFDAIRSGQIATCAVIAQLAIGCTLLKSRLTNDDISLLSPALVLNPESPYYERDSRRQNEVLTTYTQLLRSQRGDRQALEVFESLERSVDLDAESLLMKARMLERLAPARATDTYERALEVAVERIAQAPEAIVRANIAFGDFVRSNPYVTAPRRAIHFYDSAKEHVANAPYLADDIERRLRESDDH